MRILIIQTAFIGDVVLATGLIQKLKLKFPDSELHVLVRKGNEKLLQNYDSLKVHVLDKKQSKLKSIFGLISDFNKLKWEYVINLHRFASTGFITWRISSGIKIGFDKNPLSFLYNQKYPHVIGSKNKFLGHEIDRNQSLIASFTEEKSAKPVLIPSENDFLKVQEYTLKTPYLVIAPCSLWFTKQYPKELWQKLLAKINQDFTIYLVGGPDDIETCEFIKSDFKNVINLAGKLSFLETVALMKNAKRVLVNDSAPLHFASAINAPTTAIFCSTIPEFGFGPLSDDSIVIETNENLDCRPCGLHVYKKCPKGHFKCAYSIDSQAILNTFQLNYYFGELNIFSSF